MAKKVTQPARRPAAPPPRKQAAPPPPPPRKQTQPTAPTRAVATSTGGGALPAHIARAQQEYGQKGLSKDMADNLVPLIYILQALSPQAQPRNPAYMEGAVAGSIWMRNAPVPIVNGEEGFEFQPCFFSKVWIEWVPREEGGGGGNGFRGRHKELPDEAHQVEDPKTGRVRWVSDRGTVYVETREFVGFVLREDEPPLPYVIPMSSTNHTIGRGWMTMMNGKGVASFCGKYRLTTQYRQNDQGDWFCWKVDDAGWVESEDDIKRGAALHDSFAEGARDVGAEGYGEAADGEFAGNGDDAGDDPETP